MDSLDILEWSYKPAGLIKKGLLLLYRFICILEWSYKPAGLIKQGLLLLYRFICIYIHLGIVDLIVL